MKDLRLEIVPKRSAWEWSRVFAADPKFLIVELMVAPLPLRFFEATVSTWDSDPDLLAPAGPRALLRSSIAE